MFELTSIRHAFPERAIHIERKNGHRDYTFLHFFHSVNLLVDGMIVRTKPHAVVLFNRGTPQFFENDTPILHDWMHIRGDIEPLLQANGLCVDTVYYPNHYDFITAIMREMETEFYSGRRNREKLTELKMEELFLKLGRAVQQEQEPDIDLSTLGKFRYLRGQMFSSLEEKWPVERMAEIVGLSQSRFYTVYKSVYGISPTADLIAAKMEKAATLLQTGKESVDAIAEALGYENTTHFIRQFKLHTGFSPTAYRKKHG